MLNADLKDVVLSRILPNVKTPAQYIGGELNSSPQGPPGVSAGRSAWRSPTPTRSA